MDRTILNKYKKPEEKLILSKVFDKINFCNTRNQVQITDFLDLAEQQLIEKFLQLQKVENYIFFGAFEEAERKVVVFYPTKLKELVKEEKLDFGEWIKVIKINLPNENKGKYEHKNYLGALMKLGIKREKIGDILVDEEGADIIIHKDILTFLKNNLPELTRFQKANIQETSFINLRKIVCTKEQIKITVSSMRLDNIVGELAKCSRNSALELIEEEKVFVNFEQISKQTKEIKENDKITIRGKGRFVVKEILGRTKKEKIIVIMEKF